MRKRITALLILLTALFILCSCASNSTFNIQFIDVGQGDSALVECDGHYMLIDGGNKAAGEKVYDVLQEKNIQHLDILAFSHTHEDHIGGFPKALTYAAQADLVLGNRTDDQKEAFKVFEHALHMNDADITVPKIGDQYKLGSASVEVVDIASNDGNECLVLLIAYGKTRFLFTGDIEDAGQTRLSDKYQSSSDKPFKIDLIKMPHHGARSHSMYRFLRTFMPDYAIISVGRNNSHRHPDQDTLDQLKDAGAIVYRTDLSGDIFVQSNGKKISVTTSK